MFREQEAHMNDFRDRSVRMLNGTMGEEVIGNETLRGQDGIWVIHGNSEMIPGDGSSWG